VAGCRDREEDEALPLDLTDEEWERISPLLPKPAKKGRKAAVDLREVLNRDRTWRAPAVAGGCLPHDFPPWQTVIGGSRRFVRMLLFRTIHDVALMIDRERSGRAGEPDGRRDRQPVGEGSGAKKRGYDAAKKIVGRKRHIAVDTDGRLLMVNLTTADISDSAGAQMICTQSANAGPSSSMLFADGAYDPRKLMDKRRRKASHRGCPAHPRPAGFNVLPRRWWSKRNLRLDDTVARLVRDYEKRIDVAKAIIHVAMGSLLLRRIAH